MSNREPFSIDEWYHCYNRGIDKRQVFQDERDSDRFLMALYLANGSRPVKLFEIEKPALTRVLTRDRGNQIVAIGAYSLMPNHFHLLLKEVVEGGISAFMRRLGIAYTMYFNARHERTGNLFTKPFRSKHIATDDYFQQVLHYIHCNPAELYEPDWKSGRVRNMSELESRLITYPYSSLKSYARGIPDAILSRDGFETVDRTPFSRMLRDSQRYYRNAGLNP
ncbi:MAG: transposase [Patescibacteria group bacterium]|nr:transposase [Patescibacteria group bacterium]